MEEQGLYTIGELAELAQVTPRTIRYYSAEGLLPAPDMRGKYALYGDEHLRRLELIRRLKEAFLPLHEIRTRLQALTAEEVRALVASEAAALDHAAVAPADEEPGSAADYITRLLAARSQGLKKQARPETLAESGAPYVVPAPAPASPAPAVPDPDRPAPAGPSRAPATAPSLPAGAPLAPEPAAKVPAPAPAPAAPAGPEVQKAGSPRSFLRRLLVRGPEEETILAKAEQAAPLAEEVAELALEPQPQVAERRERRKELAPNTLARAEPEAEAPARYQRHQLVPGVELHVQEPVSQDVQDFVERVIDEARARFG